MEFLNSYKKEDYVIVELNRGKVNAINHAMVQEIRETFADLQNDDSIRGVIITGKPHYFSAGLDVVELYDYNYEQIKQFWIDFLGMMVDLIKFPKPLVAAISGHSPAGGAILALTCDYRLMAEGEKYLIGLNEVAVGINITESIYTLYSFWLGKRTAYQALLAGKLFNVNEARQVGLIDQIADLAGLVEEAEHELKMILQANDYIIQSAKKMMRAELVRHVDVDMSASIKERCDYWMSPQSRKDLGAFVNRLTQGKK